MFDDTSDFNIFNDENDENEENKETGGDYDFNKKWLKNAYNLTEEQNKIIDNENEKGVFVIGPAGSGKTVIATNRFYDSISKGIDSNMIVFTKTLKHFIRSGMDKLYTNDLDNISSYHKSIKHIDSIKTPLENLNSSHILLDEAQDFKVTSMVNLLKNNNSKIDVFGDDAQKLYQDRISMQVLEDKYSDRFDQIYRLNEIYRTPQKIMEFANYITDKKVLNNKSLDYNSKVNIYHVNPDLNYYNIKEKEVDVVIKIMQDFQIKNDIAILVNKNDSIDIVTSRLAMNNISYQFKKDDDDHDINFNKENTVSVLTYHSSKGLEFKHVFVLFTGKDDVYANKNNDNLLYKNALFVATTRTSFFLSIIYSGLELNSFMSTALSELKKDGNYKNFITLQEI